jgi:hypothetical protein
MAQASVRIAAAKITAWVMGAAELQLGDEAHEKYAALLYR